MFILKAVLLVILLLRVGGILLKKVNVQEDVIHDLFMLLANAIGMNISMYSSDEIISRILFFVSVLYAVMYLKICIKDASAELLKLSRGKRLIMTGAYIFTACGFLIILGIYIYSFFTE